MKNITLEQLLEAGCHFGHQITRSNPKARDFIFEARDGIHIIDLAKTKEGLEEAGKFIKSVAQNPSANIVVVGTKRQTQEILKSELDRVAHEITGEPGLYWVTNKWIGGLLTNFSEVSKNFKKLNDLMHKLETPSEQEGFTKKEIGQWRKEKEKLESFYGGVFKMTRIPDALFIIDSHLEHTAVTEAIKTGIPTAAITDTNSDPALVDYPIPANDDAVGSLELIISYILDAWREGRNSVKIEKPKEEKKVEAKKPSLNASPQEVLAHALKEEEKKNPPKSSSSAKALKDEKVSTDAKALVDKSEGQAKDKSLVKKTTKK